MPINYAEKYSTYVDERFKKQSLSNGAVNQDLEWVGVETVKVFSVPTVPMQDYTPTGTNRYGTPAELENSVQEMKVTRDRSFTFTIDNKSKQDTMGVMEAGKALARQIDEVVVPEVDIYRFAVICANAGNTAVAPITKDNAYEAFLDATTTLTDLKVPLVGRVAYIGPNFYKQIRLDPSFIKASDLAQTALMKGQVGEVDGVPLITVPSSYLPANVEFFITHPMATVAPIKLTDYVTHENPPGINGTLVEGRIRYDAFVFENKKNAIYVHKKA
jgi:N4-gp56 family major capsid protein